MSLLAQSKPFPRRGRTQPAAAKRKANSRKDFRRAFLEALEPRQVMATFGDTGFGDIPKTGGTFFEQHLDTYDGVSKVVASDPRVQAWQTADFVTDSFLVRFQDAVDRTQAEATLAAEAPGSSILEWNDDLHNAWVSLPAGTTRENVLTTAHHFLSLSNTLYAEPNFLRELRRTPDDPFYPLQWNMNNTGQLIPDDTFPAFNPYIGTIDADVDAPEAWDITTGSPNEVIAILDSGYNRFEAQMQANYWVNPRETYDGKDNDGNGVIDDYNGYDAAMRDGDPQDDAVSEHGMQVASIAAAPGNDGQGMTGISWNSKLMFVKIEDDTGSITTGGVIGGIQYVTKMKQTYGINIVSANMSFGGPTFSFSESDALRVLGTKDVLIVAAAANQGYNHDILFDAPTGYNVDQIIAVTATSAYDEMAVPVGIFIPGNLPEFGYGAVNVDIAAPGIDVMLTGFRYLIGGTGFFTNLSVSTGTSFAAPLVAGTAALMENLAPYLTALEIKQLIIGSADKTAYLNNLNVADGRLNVFSALSAIPKTTISGTVFQDANNDKVQGIGETGLGGWTVYVDLDNDSVFDVGEPSTVTITNTGTTGPLTGTYSFDAYLNTGSYRVRQVLQTPYVQTTPTTNGGANVINVTTRGQDFTGVNFGNRQQPGSISGTKFLDLDADGTRDPGEPGLPNIFFFVDYNNNGRPNANEPSAISGPDGNWIIPNIQPGTYNVREVLGGGYVPTVPSTQVGGLPDPVLPVTVTSNTTTNPPLLFGNQVARDYGDLPESLAGVPDAYNTLIASGGPSHGILPGFMLGTRQDFETDGRPSPTALGDDNFPAGADDEDGLVSINLVQGTQGVISLRVTNSGRKSGYISAWIDFAGDGSFSQAGDQILRNFVPVDGLNSNIPFAIPNGATAGVTYARIRYSYQQNLEPDGPAVAGEVEDYQLTIFSNSPIASPDRFPEQLFPAPNDPAYPADPLIKQESTNNPLDVLRNDPLPASGQLRILPGSFPANVNGNTLTLGVDANGRDILLFTPRGGINPFTGVYNFQYQVYDPTKYPADPLAVSTPATVQVLVTAKDPRPVDNTYTMVGDVPANPAPRPVTLTMDVLANDVFTPSAPISLGSFTQPTYPAGTVVTGPTVARDITNPNVLVITPPTGFIGTVQFTYTVTDSDPSTVDATALVTVQVTGNPSPPAGPVDPQYLAKITLQIEDARGFIQGVDPGFHVDVGERVIVNVYSEDIRPGGSNLDRGVEAAFLDLLYDPDLLAFHLENFDSDPQGTVEPFEWSPDYDFDRNGILNSPEGVINELGGAHNSDATNAPVGQGPVLVVRVHFDAIASGTFTFVSDPAEDAGDRSQILLAPDLLPPNPPDPPTPGTIPTPAADNQVFLVPVGPLTINSLVGPEFVNTFDSLDVNADTRITAFDALAVVNELNSNGTRSLREYDLGNNGKLLPQYYVDVNNDGVVTAFDAIQVINWLNRHPGSGEATSGGEFAPLTAGSSAGENVEPAGSEESSGSSSNTVPPPASQSGGSQATSGERRTPRANPTQDDAALLYLTAVDELMTSEDVGSDSPTAAAMSLADWLEIGSELSSVRVKRNSRSR